MERRFKVIDGSYNMMCKGDGVVKYQSVGHNSPYGKVVEVLARDLELPFKMTSHNLIPNNTIIRDEDGTIYFTRMKYLKEIKPEKMIEVAGKEYSESTLQKAMQQYVG